MASEILKLDHFKTLSFEEWKNLENLFINLDSDKDFAYLVTILSKTKRLEKILRITVRLFENTVARLYYAENVDYNKKLSTYIALENLRNELVDMQWQLSHLEGQF